MRQCPDRYAIRAGQNLPDKEFRYLRTVIVTAAVYRGFDSMLRLLPMHDMLHAASFVSRLASVIVFTELRSGNTFTLKQDSCFPYESWCHTFHQKYDSCIRRSLTSPLNLPAPGRRQPLYVVFRLSRDLCFW